VQGERKRVTQYSSTVLQRQSVLHIQQSSRWFTMLASSGLALQARATAGPLAGQRGGQLCAGGARWTPHTALVVLSAGDVHQRITGGATQRTAALEGLLAILMLRFRGTRRLL